MTALQAISPRSRSVEAPTNGSGTWRVRVRPVARGVGRPAGHPGERRRALAAPDRAPPDRPVTRRHLPRRDRATGRQADPDQGQGDPAQRRRRERDMSMATATGDAPLTGGRETRPAPRIPHSGWRVIAAKEFGDHLLSVRFLVLLIVLGLAARHPALLRGGSRSEAWRPQATGVPAVFLALFTVGSRGCRHPARRRLRRPRGATARARLRVRRRQRRASRGHAAHGCSPSRSIATTSSTASSSPGWRSSGWCW